jgi:hypothetical protein
MVDRGYAQLLSETKSDLIFFQSDPPHWKSDANEKISIQSCDKKNKIKFQSDPIPVFKNQFLATANSAKGESQKISKNAI